MISDVFAGLSRMLVHADILKRSAINGATEAIRRACELPMNTAILTEVRCLNQCYTERMVLW